MKLKQAFLCVGFTFLSSIWTAHAFAASRCADVFSKSDYAESLMNVQAMIAIEGASPWNMHALFKAHYEAGAYREALQASRETLKLYPEDAISLFNEVKALYSLGHAPQALRKLRVLLRNYPENNSFLEMREQIQQTLNGD